MEVEKKHSTNDSKLEELRSLVTNQVVLIWVAIFFALFVVAEMIGALASGSLSLLGDASAMAVDVITYFTNLYAEIMKQKHQVLSNQTRMILEVYIPLFSVIALLSVTGYITSDAITVLSSPSSDGDGVNIYFLWAFSSANGLVDIASVTLFYLRGKQGLIAKDLTKEHDTTPSSSSSGSSSGDNTPVSVELPAISSNVVEEDEENVPVSPTPLLAGHSSSSRPKRKCIPNLNMMSALTHVSSDSLRTTSVFVAAAISSSTGLSSTRCDAWASIIVTMTILLCILPLCREIYHSYHSLSSSSSSSSSSS